MEERGGERREIEGRKMGRRDLEMSFGDAPHNLSSTSMAES